MGPITKKIFVLKAFNLGYGIRNNLVLKDKALQMVNTAIEYFENKNNITKAEGSRLLFYYLMKCEILREDERIFDLRNKVRSYAKKIREIDGYQDYMKAVDETVQKKISGDINQKTRFKGDISLSDGFAMVEDEDDWSWSTTDSTLRALCLNGVKLTRRQEYFLDVCSLKDILAMHRINCT